MRLYKEEFWPGHSATWLIVQKWRRIYRYFNLVFALASLPHEYIITTEDQHRSNVAARKVTHLL